MGMTAPLVTIPADETQVSHDAILQRAVEIARSGQYLEEAARLEESCFSGLRGTVLRQALDAVLTARHADIGLQYLLDCGLLDALLPELTEMVGLGDGNNKHKDVWKHTKQVVIQAMPWISVRWAALLHDVAKPRTRSIDSSGAVHFHHHSEKGARMFTKMDKRLDLFKNDDELRERIRFLIYHHQRAHQYDGTWTDSGVRRFAKEMDLALDDLMALSRADMTTKRKDKRRRFMAQLKELSVRISELKRLDALVPPLPKGLGEAITDKFGIPPSRKIGELKRFLETSVETQLIESHQEAEYYINYLVQHSQELEIAALS